MQGDTSKAIRNIIIILAAITALVIGIFLIFAGILGGSASVPINNEGWSGRGSGTTTGNFNNPGEIDAEGYNGDSQYDCAHSLNSRIKPEYVEWANKYAKQYGVPTALLLAQMEQESAFNPSATSPVGAQGLTQFMPETWREEGIDANGNGNRSPLEPEDAIASQARYMAKIKTSWLNPNLRTWNNTLAAYNAGAGNVNKYGGIPPFKETQDYVKIISSRYKDYDKCKE